MRSLRARLFLATFLAVLVSIALTLGVGAFLVRRSIQRSLVASLGRQADVIALREASAGLDDAQVRALRVLLRTQGVFLSVATAPVSPDHPGLPIPSGAVDALNRGEPAQGQVRFGRVDLLYAARAAGGHVVVLSRTARLGSSDWRPYLGSLLVAGMAGAALAAGASLLLARAIGRPIRRAAEASRRLAAGEAPPPLPVEGSEELAVLASSFNDMAAQLVKAREAEQSFLLSVSHELKTPLTAIRGYAEALEEQAVDPREAGEVLTGEAARLERLVQDLLDLARMNQHAFAVRREPVDLAEVAHEAVRRYDPRARGFGVSLEARAPVAAPALADSDRVLQVVSNLVENALRCTPAGGAVTVSAGPGEISVTDTGPGLAPEDVPRAFERFFLHGRYGGERPVGTGLGLALVKELTQAMGGSVTVESARGAGSTFSVRLPVETLPDRPDLTAERSKAGAS